MPNYRIADDVRIVPLFSGNVDGSSRVYSKPIDLSGCRHVAVVAMSGTRTAAQMATAVVGDIMVGHSSEGVSSFSSLVGGGFTLISSGSTQTGMLSARIWITGTFTTGKIASAATLCSLDSYVWYVASANAVITASQVRSSNVSACAMSLASNISCLATYLAATGVSTNATNAYVDVSVKAGEYGKRTFSVKTTGLTTASGDSAIGLEPLLKAALVEFTVDDVAATNSSYTQFALRLTEGQSSGDQWSAFAILSNNRFMPATSNFATRVLVSTISSAFAT